MGPELNRILDARAVLIAGPTASGKSAAALRIADAFDRRGRHAVIVNADSMQVYDALRVLSARPGPGEEARLSHRLYGHVPAETRYSVARWLADAGEILREAAPSAALPIFVGGTGLYFKALTEGLAEIPPVPEEIRSYWAERHAELGSEALHAALSRRDPLSAEAIRAGDQQRILRALEVLDATGASIVYWQGRQQPPLLSGRETARFVVEPDRAELYRRIDDRFDRMVERGALDEVRRLRERALDPALPVMKAIGVREFGAFMNGETGLPDAVDAAKMQTRRYAKRQMTWFRNQMADWERVRALHPV